MLIIDHRDRRDGYLGTERLLRYVQACSEMPAIGLILAAARCTPFQSDVPFLAPGQLAEFGTGQHQRRNIDVEPALSSLGTPVAV